MAVINLPLIKDAWWDLGIAMANSYAARIVPNWHKDFRNIYMVNKYPELSQQAYTAMQRNGYARAFAIWENMLLQCRKRGQKTTKSQITYNMAVACEYQNDLEQAIHWLEVSMSHSKTRYSENYLNLLKERKNQREKLDMQTKN